MIVLCKKTQGNFPPLVIPRNQDTPVSSSNFVSSSEWYTISAEISGYCISLSKEYIVYGLLVYDQLLRYLIVDDEGIPGFFPSSLFSVQNNSVLYDWEVCEYSTAMGKILVIGYPALAKAYCHLVNLIECHTDAIEEFLNNKEQHHNNI